MYIASGGKRRDSWAGVAIYRAAKKAISYQVIHMNDLRVFNDQVLHGDHFLCAWERQKDLFVGSLLSLLRINPEILDMMPSLDDLISVVHFGITPDGGEETGERVIRGRIPGIEDDDILLFWGGVIIN
jgi:hypothetical protein